MEKRGRGCVNMMTNNGCACEIDYIKKADQISRCGRLVW